MATAKKPKQEPTWGPESELKFIDGLGDHRQEGYAVYHSERQWLEMYIRVHKESPYRHHRHGVKYAQEKLEVLNRG